MISKNTVIGCLVFSAVVLGSVLFVQVAVGPRTAYAGVITRAGSYSIVTAAFDDDMDILWMHNVKEGKLIACGFDRKGDPELLAQADMKDAFEREEEAKPTRSRRGRR